MQFQRRIRTECITRGSATRARRVDAYPLGDGSEATFLRLAQNRQTSQAVKPNITPGTKVTIRFPSGVNQETTPLVVVATRNPTTVGLLRISIGVSKGALVIV